MSNLPQTAIPNGPRRNPWPAMVGAVLTLAVQAGWSPAEVRSLAIELLVLIALIVTSQAGLTISPASRPGPTRRKRAKKILAF